VSIAQRRTRIVFGVFEELALEGCTEIRPGDIAARMRARNQPMSVWEIRGELSNLEALGSIELNPDTASWRLATERTRKVG
jgi:hypothetical protein